MATIDGKETKITGKQQSGKVHKTNGTIECQGTFTYLPAESFQLDDEKRYSDAYLWSKGLWERYGGVITEEGTAAVNEDGTYVKVAKETVGDEDIDTDGGDDLGSGERDTADTDVDGGGESELNEG